ncbi:MAG: YbaN family protein [Candidatus Kapabacteria bacterium]|nr:YbaN family protein [Ignavibacteriota bacterium]MCW5885832.1 YbaN family protein [Candidatus Kapabacteria bacterium]
MNEYKIEPNIFKRFFYQFMGIFCVILGIIGIFLPVWPTTIFIILAAWFFIRSSEKYYEMLIRNKMFGRMIRNYREFRGIESKARIKSLILTWLTLGVSFFLVEILWVRLILIAVGIGVTWHLYALKTLTEDEIRRLDNATN